MVPPPAEASDLDAAVRRAIETAVAGRFGARVDVAVEDVHVTVGGEGRGLVAVPAPGARTDRPCVFSLSAAAPDGARRRIGSALATVHVAGTHVRAARPLARGTVLSAADLVASGGPLSDVPLAPLSTIETLAGARLLRDVSAGSILTASVVQAVPLVRSGDVVIIRTRIGGVLVEGRAIASQTGGDGDVIRVVNPDSRRTLHGRIVGRGEVEVMHES